MVRTTLYGRDWLRRTCLRFSIACGRAGAQLLPRIAAGQVLGSPENALSTLENTLRQVPTVLEMDIARTRDGVQEHQLSDVQLPLRLLDVGMAKH